MAIVREFLPDKRRALPRVLTLTSDAVNMYDLCLDAAAVIEEERNRYDQGHWVIQNPNKIVATLQNLHDELESDYEEGKAEEIIVAAPQCGTMACRAGWICQLADGHFSRYVEERAYELFGIMDHQNDDRYRWNTLACSLFKLFSGKAVSGYPGTIDYAKRGADGLREFANEWKATLLTLPVRRREGEYYVER